MSTIKAGKIQPPGDSDPLQIFTNTVERITVTSGGLVGVGTASPTSMLHVAGTANITSGVTLGSTLNVGSTLTVGTATMAVPSGSAPIFGARAWVVFDSNKNAAGTVETTLSATNRYIKQSGNIATVKREGVGLFTITFTTAMPHADYVVILSIASNFTNLTQGVVLTSGSAETSDLYNNTLLPLQPFNKTTTSFTIHTGSTSVGTKLDPYSNPISALVFA